MKKFAFIADGDVFVIWAVQEGSNPGADQMIAGLQSNPTVVEIPEDSEIAEGWTYDSFGFHPPK